MDIAPALFEAVIVPHRSLSPRGVRRLIAVIAAMCGLTGLRFWLLGAWPVAAFGVVEIGLAAFLIRLNARRARARELILLTDEQLLIQRTDMHGAREERYLPSGWLRVSLEERAGCVPGLFLVAHGIREEIARALGDAEKRDLAAALATALSRMRNPRFDNPVLAV